MRQGRQIGVEFCVALCCFLSLIYQLRETLIFGHTTFGHDSFYWGFPIFHYFAESLLLGQYPWWNPYSHGGEPFYPLILQLRLLEPLTLLVIFIGSLITKNLGILFAWNKIVLNLFFLFGIYVNLRPLAKFQLTKLTLITILFFSSLMLNSFGADGVAHNFLWVPYLLYALNKIFEESLFYSRYYFLIALSLGSHFQSYLFSIPVSLLIVYLVLQFFFNPRTFIRWVKLEILEKKAKPIILPFALMVLMLAPNFALLLESNKFVYPARQLPADFKRLPARGSSQGVEGNLSSQTPGFRIDYEAIRYSGSFSTIWNYLQMFSPQGNYHIHKARDGFTPWGKPSEVYFYIGIIPALFLLYAFFILWSPQLLLYKALLVIFAFFSLGPNAFLYPFVFDWMPSLWFLRHTQFFMQLVLFLGLFLFVAGMDKWISKTRPFFHYTAFLIIVLDLFICFKQSDALYAYFYHPHWLLGTKAEPETFQPPRPRLLAPHFIPLSTPQSQSMRYLDLLYRQNFTFSIPRSVEKNPDKFSSVLLGTRWDSLFLLKTYFELIHTSNSETLKRAFAFEKSWLHLENSNLEPVLKSYNPSNYEITFPYLKKAALHIADGFDAHWKASLNEKPIEIQQDYLNFKRIDLPSPSANEHLATVKLRYLPLPFALSLCIFYLALGTAYLFACKNFKIVKIT